MDASVLVNPSKLGLDSGNCILTGRGRRYYVRAFAGPLSIKSMLHGSAVWRTNEAAHRVTEESWLLLNHGQTYSLTIDEDDPVETFVVFLRRGLVDEAAASLTLPEKALLDDPDAVVPSRFREGVRRHDGAVTPVLRDLKRALREGSPFDGYMEEKFLLLANSLAIGRREIQVQIARLSATRAATRLEVHRRLENARDFLEENLARPIQLKHMARVACLSSFHFHRQFTLAFGQPPHRWLALRRLAEARRLLSETDLPISEVSMKVGFESLGSFCTLFRRHFGLTPTAVRAGMRK